MENDVDYRLTSLVKTFAEHADIYYKTLITTNYEIDQFNLPKALHTICLELNSLIFEVRDLQERIYEIDER